MSPHVLRFHGYPNSLKHGIGGGGASGMFIIIAWIHFVFPAGGSFILISWFLFVGKARGIEGRVSRLPLDQPEERVVLLGHSFGGYFAACYAMKYPQRVESLILASPAPWTYARGAGGGFGYRSKSYYQGTAGFGPCFHLPGSHFGYIFLPHRHFTGTRRCVS